MDKNSSHFYISGFISLGLFTLFFMLFITMLFTPTKNSSFALKKDTFISISLELPKVQTKKAKKQEKAAVVEAPKVVESKPVDINNLFSDVWTKKIVHKKEKPKPVDKRRLLAIQKSIQTKKANDVKSISKKINEMENVKSNNQESSSSTAQEVNEYLAKIQAIVYQYFQVPPNSEGKSVKTVIELNAFGKVLDFRILTYSDNSALNQEADKIKERLKNITFPINPQHKSSRTIVILISKE